MTAIRVDGDYLVVGDRRWWGCFHSWDVEGDDYEWKGRQFIVSFESKWNVSVIWGYATYSDNHDMPWHSPGQVFVEEPERVEAAILHADREGVQGGDVFGYLDVEQLNTLLTMVSLLATNESIQGWALDE